MAHGCRALCCNSGSEQVRLVVCMLPRSFLLSGHGHASQREWSSRARLSRNTIAGEAGGFFARAKEASLVLSTQLHAGGRARILLSLATFARLPHWCAFALTSPPCVFATQLPLLLYHSHSRQLKSRSFILFHIYPNHNLFKPTQSQSHPAQMHVTKSRRTHKRSIRPS